MRLTILIVDIFVLFMVILGIVAIYAFRDPKIEFIPTAINGLTTSMSVIFGFSAFLLAFTMKEYPPEKIRNRVGVLIVALVTGLLLLGVTYYDLVFRDSLVSLKVAFINSYICTVALLHYIMFLSLEFGD